MIKALVQFNHTRLSKTDGFLVTTERRHYFNGEYTVTPRGDGVDIDGVLLPYSVFNSQVEPYLVWTRISVTPTLVNQT